MPPKCHAPHGSPLTPCGPPVRTKCVIPSTRLSSSNAHGTISKCVLCIKACGASRPHKFGRCIECMRVFLPQRGVPSLDTSFICPGAYRRPQSRCHPPCERHSHHAVIAWSCKSPRGCSALSFGMSRSSSAGRARGHSTVQSSSCCR